MTTKEELLIPHLCSRETPTTEFQRLLSLLGMGAGNFCGRNSNVMTASGLDSTGKLWLRKKSSTLIRRISGPNIITIHTTSGHQSSKETRSNITNPAG